MQFLVVILAAFVAYAFGAVWYTFMSKPWMVAAGIPMDASGKPKGNGGAMPFVIGFVATLLVAGMMLHVFVQSHLGTVGLGAMGGFGIGAFLGLSGFEKNEGPLPLGTPHHPTRTQHRTCSMKGSGHDALGVTIGERHDQGKSNAPKP